MTAVDYIKLGGAALGAVTVVFFGWKAYKYLKDRAANRSETKEYRQELNKNNLTLSDSEFQSIADSIFTAINTGWYQDDDEDLVYRELSKLKTPDDWKKLVIVFGKRKRNTWTSDVDGGLKEWLVDALSTSEQKEVSEILSKIGVNF
jgi:hypothetical protein